ncbi:MAG: hypothetical protein N4A35_09150 [Flavobacteriales bacterium]|nr:hypothetical protein [Flavobacteriales bacterium]
MMSLIAVVLTVTVHAQFGVKAKKVDEIFLKLNKKQNFNKGSKFKYTICARMKNGKVKELSNNSGVEIYGEGIEKRGRNELLILKSNDCEKETYVLNYSFTKGDYFFKGKDSVQLNYRGRVLCNFSGADGKDGVDGKKENLIERSIRGRDGDDGYQGGNGEDGNSGPYLKAFVRKDSLSDFILIDVFNLDNNQLYCYKTTSLSNGITFFAKGGKGGNGGDGSAGQDGRNEVEKNNGKIKRSGDGGDGGNGGSGGNGGIGGVVEVYVHRGVANDAKKIIVQNQGGEGGKPGKGGAAGEAGKNIDGSVSQQNGLVGVTGVTGVVGMVGEQKILRVVDDLNFKLF